MMSKMKKILLAVLVAVGFAVPQLSAQQSVAAKYVDQDGFTYAIRD